MIQITTQRQCGTCTMCCKLIGIKELSKPAGTWCVHCDIGVGCKIHIDRPESCRLFDCLWILDPKLPDDLRPDICNVVLSTTPDGSSLIMYVDKDAPDAYKSEALRKTIQRIVDAGQHVILVEGDLEKFVA